ncbi:MAG: GAF domain-containing protein, partial [Polyangiaceae bacterium]|nr:GAF domain-containing protein [Polyangiaceae bacterium]
MQNPFGNDVPANLNERLLALSQAIAGAPDEQAVAECLVGTVAAASVDSCHIWRLRKGVEPFLEVVIAWDRNGDPSPRVGARVPRSSISAFDAVTPQCPVVSPSDAPDPRGYFALVERGDVFGVLELKPGRILDPGEVQFFRAVAQIAAMGLRHADSKTALRNKLKQFKGLYDIAEIIGEIADPKAIIETAASLLVAKIGFINAFIATVDEHANVLREQVTVGLGGSEGREKYVFPLDATEVTCVSALRAGRPFQVENIQQLADAEGWGETARIAGMRSAGYMPLRAGGKVLGVLSYGSHETRIADDELSLLGAFTNQLASTLARVEMNIERDRQIAALEHANANQARLLETVRELSTPVIPVHDGVLVLPIVGMIDTGRSAQI